MSSLDHIQAQIEIVEAEIAEINAERERDIQKRLEDMRHNIAESMFCDQCGKTFNYPDDGYHSSRNDKAFYVCSISCAKWAAYEKGMGCIIHHLGGYTEQHRRILCAR